MNNAAELIFKALRIEIEKAFEKIGNKLVREGKLKLREDKKYASRDLINSITYEVIQQNYSAFSLKFGSPLPYLKYVHEGRVAGKFPPWDKATKTFPQIETWITQKRIFTDMPIRQAAFIVAKKIKEKGIDPYPFLRLIIQQNESWMRSQLELALNNVKA